MLNRRYLRVKVLQALYAYFQSGDTNPKRYEHDMFKSIENIYRLYLSMLQLIIEVVVKGRLAMEESKQKKLPTPEDLAPNTKFINSNRLIAKLESNVRFQKAKEKYQVSWSQEEEQELLLKLYREIKGSKLYKHYMNEPDSDFDSDREFVKRIFKNHIAEFDLLKSMLAERSIYWYDDHYLVSINVIKTIQTIQNTTGDSDNILLALYKNRKEDEAFTQQLFRKTTQNDSGYTAMIGDKTMNWDVDRIAVMDVILMKMALCEFEHFDTIPVKVSLNEYIELSKDYSTPNSNAFINGVLDKILADMKEKGHITKTGRGLVG